MFPPLAWRIGAYLVQERERACDEEVLSGSHSEVYADASFKRLQTLRAIGARVCIRSIRRNHFGEELRPSCSTTRPEAGLGMS